MNLNAASPRPDSEGDRPPQRPAATAHARAQQHSHRSDCLRGKACAGTDRRPRSAVCAESPTESRGSDRVTPRCDTSIDAATGFVCTAWRAWAVRVLRAHARGRRRACKLASCAPARVKGGTARGRSATQHAVRTFHCICDDLVVDPGRMPENSTTARSTSDQARIRASGARRAASSARDAALSFVLIALMRGRDAMRPEASCPGESEHERVRPCHLWQPAPLAHGRTRKRAARCTAHPPQAMFLQSCSAAQRAAPPACGALTGPKRGQRCGLSAKAHRQLLTWRPLRCSLVRRDVSGKAASGERSGKGKREQRGKA